MGSGVSASFATLDATPLDSSPPSDAITFPSPLEAVGNPIPRASGSPSPMRRLFTLESHGNSVRESLFHLERRKPRRHCVAGVPSWSPNPQGFWKKSPGLKLCNSPRDLGRIGKRLALTSKAVTPLASDKQRRNGDWLDARNAADRSGYWRSLTEPLPAAPGSWSGLGGANRYHQRGA
jgi:hypothetical protein